MTKDKIMLGHTHALFGAAAVIAAQTATNFIQPHPVEDIPVGVVLCVGAGILGALLPDIDAEDSTIKREMGAAGSVVSGGLHLLGVKHRGFTHYEVTTLLVMVLALVIGVATGFPDVGIAFGLGYFSHTLIADAMTKTGVPSLLLRRRFHLLPKALRIRTGGPVESLIFLAVGVGVVFLLPEVVPAEWLAWFVRSG